MPTVTTKDGVEIFYKDWGSGQPIVFSHGWPLSSDDWDTQMLFFLNHGFRVIAHDRRGHGRSRSAAPAGSDVGSHLRHADQGIGQPAPVHVLGGDLEDEILAQLGQAADDLGVLGHPVGLRLEQLPRVRERLADHEEVADGERLEGLAEDSDGRQGGGDGFERAGYRFQLIRRHLQPGRQRGRTRPLGSLATCDSARATLGR